MHLRTEESGSRRGPSGHQSSQQTRPGSDHDQITAQRLDLHARTEAPRAHWAVHEPLFHLAGQLAELGILQVVEVSDGYIRAGLQSIDVSTHESGAIVIEVVMQRADLKQSHGAREIQCLADRLVLQHVQRPEYVGLGDGGVRFAGQQCPGVGGSLST